MSDLPFLDSEIEDLLQQKQKNPHGILGVHPKDNGECTIATLKPGAIGVSVKVGTKKHELTKFKNTDFWYAILPYPNLDDYRYDVKYNDTSIEIADGYHFLPTLGELDLHLFNEGKHEFIWKVLGAHVRSYKTINGEVDGVSFAVWAPNAIGINVIGDFNLWDRVGLPMRSMGLSGVWEIFVPGVKEGDVYKYRIHTKDGSYIEKADPYARRTEIAPATGSIVEDSNFKWNDDKWLAKRENGQPVYEPMSIYEIHLGSWMDIPDKNYVTIAKELSEYVKDKGFTHIELLPIAEHPFGGSWGYQVTSYFAPTSRFGTPDQFREFVDIFHQAGIGVIIDWVPAHFPKDEWALARFDGTALYEHSDPRKGEQLDWGTYVFDFGRYEVKNFLVANALYWFSEYHVDGIRVDAVASMLYLDYSRPDGQWIPNKNGGRENLEAVAFLQEFNTTVHKHHKGIVTIAEESTTWPGVTKFADQGGLGFSFKWNMGWMNDTLSYFSRDPIHRGHHHHEITFSMMYAWSENFLLPLSHDEVVHGKGTLWSRMTGGEETKAASVRTLFAYQWAHPGKQLIFMGQEFGQILEWNESKYLSWDLIQEDNSLHNGVANLVQDLNEIYKQEPALWSLDNSYDGFSWINPDDNQGNTISFLRLGEDGSKVACVFNLSGVEHQNYRIGVPEEGEWKIILNTSMDRYKTNRNAKSDSGKVTAESNHTWDHRPHSVSLNIPAYTAIWLKHIG